MPSRARKRFFTEALTHHKGKIMGKQYEGKEATAAAGKADDMLASIDLANKALWMALAMALVKSGNLSKGEVVQAIDLTAEKFGVEGIALGMVENIRDEFKSSVAAGPKD